MNKYLAYTFSFLFHPLLIPTFVVTLVLYYPGLAEFVPQERDKLLIAIFIMTFVIPVASTVTFKISGTISSLMLNERRERTIPMIFTSVIYCVTTFFCFKYLQFDFIYFKIIALVTLVIITTLIINFFYKISTHAAANAGFYAFLLALPFEKNDPFYYKLLLGYALILGFVFSARIALEAHDLRQTFLGGVLGFSICFLLKYLI